MTEPQTQPETPQLLEAWRLLKRRLWPFLAVAFLVLAAAAVITLRTVPQYRATAQIQIERQLPRSGTLQDLPFVDTYINQDYLNTQQKIIASRPMAERTLKRLGLDFGEAPDPAKAFLDRLDTKPIPRSRIIEVSYLDPDPKVAARVVNTLIEEFTSDLVKRRVSGIRALAEQLEKESRGTLEQLRKADERLQRYNEANNLTSIDDKQNLTVRRLEEAIDNLTRIEQEVAQQDALLEQVQRGDHDVDRLFRLKPVMENDVVKNLLLEEARLKQDLAAIEKKYRPLHPVYQDAETRLKDVRAALEREVRKVAEAIRVQHVEAGVRRDRARLVVEERQKEKLALDRMISEADNLRRERDGMKTLYDALVQRIKESDVAGGLEINNVTVVEPAVPPTQRAKPSLRLNAALGLMLALLLGAGTAVLVDRLDTTVKTPEEIEDLTRLPVLGVVPEAGKEAETISARDSKSQAAEGFRTVRTSIMLAPRAGKQPKSIQLTSAGPNEGKTVSSMNLAIALAQAGQRVLIMDADFHRPQLHKHFNVENDGGLSTALVTEGPLENSIRPTSIPNLWVLTAGPVPPHPAELLGSPAFQGRLEEAESKFDRVVVDSPPVCAVTDACVMAPHADAHVLVVQPGLTARAGVKRAMGLLHSVGVNPLGTLLNRVPMRSDGYYAYYRYYGYSKA